MLRKNIFIVCNIFFATWLFFSLTDVLFNQPQNNARFSEYQVLIVGIIYSLLGYYFSRNGRYTFGGYILGWGVFAYLGALLSLGSMNAQHNIYYELIFPVVVFITLYMGVRLKRHVLLTLATLYLMLYILTITSYYFANSLGWPLALMLAGLAIIFVGYFSFRLNKMIRK